MESKAKHRVLGVLVIISLVVIFLPLFQGSKEANQPIPVATNNQINKEPVHEGSIRPQLTSATEASPVPVVDSTPATLQPTHEVAAANEVAKPIVPVDANSVSSQSTPDVGIRTTPDDTIPATPHVASVASTTTASSNPPTTTAIAETKQTDQMNAVAHDDNADKKQLSKASIEANQSSDESQELSSSSAVEDVIAETENPVEDQPKKMTHTKNAVGKQSKKLAASSIDDHDVQAHSGKQKKLADSKTKENHHKQFASQVEHYSTKKYPIPFVPATTAKVQTASQLADRSTKKHSILEVKSGWVVQVGSFKRESNANHLIQSLHAKGFPVFSQSIENQTGSVVRVYVGPKSNQPAVKRIASRLHDEMKISGFILKMQSSETS